MSKFRENKTEEAGGKKKPIIEIGDLHLKSFMVELLNYFSSKLGPDVATFIRDKKLPFNHTQSENHVHKIPTDKGIYIHNMMPGMKGELKVRRKELTEVQYNKMSLEEQELVVIDIGYTTSSNTRSSSSSEETRYFIEGTIDYPIQDYEAKYEGDPYSNPRVMVASSKEKELTKCEIEWVDKVGSASAMMSEFLGPNLTFKMEGNSTYVNARKDFRIEIMIEEVIKMLRNNGGGEIDEPRRGSLSIRDTLLKLLQIKLGEHENVLRFLERYDELVQRLHTLGYHSDNLDPEVDDTNFLFGVNLIWAISGVRFDAFIDRADSAGKIKSPICTYAWAIKTVTDWNTDYSSGYKFYKTKDNISNEKKRKKEKIDNESQEPTTAKIMKTTTYNHDNQKNNGNKNIKKKNNAKASGGDTYASWKANLTCEHCNEKGHFGSSCSKASDSEKKNYKDTYLKNKADKSRDK